MTPHRARDHEDDDEEPDDWDTGGAEDDDDWDDSSDDPTVSCPSCGREIFEDSPRCPHCETYLSDDDHRGRRQPLWVSITAVICLAVVIVWAILAL